MNELLLRSAVELAGLVRAGEVSARELVAASLARIDELEPRLNAFTHVAHEQALATAAAIDPGDPRPFAGVPIAVKDNRAVAGMPLTYCSEMFAGNVAREDAYLVRRIRDAGFVIVGKTALPEAAILPTCEPRSHGATANPWALERTPGGSSGGSAAAVAAGMVPVAHANDGGGSTRIPAACCGLVGLKPARGRISVGPSSGHSYLATDGVLTRSVSETAALMDVLAGYELGDSSWAPPPVASYAQAARRPPASLRVGLVLNSPLDDAVIDPECVRGAQEAGRLLESLGHHVEEYVAPWSGLDLGQEFTRAFAPGAAMLVRAGGELLEREPGADDVEPLTWVIYEHVARQSTLDYLAAVNRLESLGRDLVRAFDRFDVVVTPALGSRPLPTGEVHGRGPDPWDHFRRSGLFTPFTAVVNVTGLPAIALPLFHGEDGLPTGVQLIGRPAGEEALLGLAAALEEALPWSERHPDL